MKIGRVLSPALAPLTLGNIFSGVAGMFSWEKSQTQFTNELKQVFGVSHCETVSSGKTALYCILKSLHKLSPEKNEVLIPAFNCYCVASAVLRAGFKVRLCEVDPNTLDFDFMMMTKELKNKDRLLCVVATHLFGMHANVSKLKSLINDDSIFIVEDAAQVMGGKENEVPLGLQADVGFFSLGRGKAYTTCEGGIIVTNRNDIDQGVHGVVETLPKHNSVEIGMMIFKAVVLLIFSRPWLFWLPKSLPFLGLGETHFEADFKIRKLSSFQAGLSWNWVKALEKIRKERYENSSFWVSFFNKNQLPGIDSIAKTNSAARDLLRFPIRMHSKELCKKILKLSNLQGLGITITYPLPLNQLPQVTGFAANAFPKAKQCSDLVVTIPVHRFVSKSDRRKIETLLKGICL